jgi:hypothetical protein
MHGDSHVVSHIFEYHSSDIFTIRQKLAIKAREGETSGNDDIILIEEG